MIESGAHMHSEVELVARALEDEARQLRERAARGEKIDLSHYRIGCNHNPFAHHVPMPGGRCSCSDLSWMR